MKDFFISYSHHDLHWAEWVGWELEAAGYSVTLQAWDFNAGGDFVHLMDRAAKDCAHVMPILTENYKKSNFGEAEWRPFFAADPSGEERRIIPVRVESCAIDGLLKTRIQIDVVGKDEAAARVALRSGVETGRGKPKIKPDFPLTKTFTVKPAFPIPGIWHVPISRNPNFTGREDVLRDLHDKFTSGRPMARTQAIFGLGGIGKTQTAAEYAWRHAAEYDVVWWVRGQENGSMLAGDMANLAETLGLPAAPTCKEDEIQAFIQEWCRAHGRWLLIFDNVDKPADIHKWLPQGAGHVLLTSCWSAWRGTAQAHEMNSWPDAEGVAFLCKRTGCDDTTGAAALVQDLGGLPLALEQAAAYIEQTGTDFKTYLKLYDSRHLTLFLAGAISTQPQDYPETVLTTWSLSLVKVRERCPIALELMDLCSFLTPDDIPRSMLLFGAQMLPPRLAETIKDDARFDAAIATLKSYSLISRQREWLHIHCLVKAVIRDQMSADRAREWHRLATIVNALWYSDCYDEDFWTEYGQLPESVAISAIRDKIDLYLDGDTRRIVSKFSASVPLPASYTHLKTQMAPATSLGVEKPRPDTEQNAEAEFQYACKLQILENMENACEHFKYACELYERSHMPDDPGLSPYLLKYGVVLRLLERSDEAKDLFERALRLEEMALEPNYHVLALSRSHLGFVHRDLGDLQAAQEQFEGALQSYEAEFGPNHPEIATHAITLGFVLWERGLLAEAQTRFEQAVRIREAAVEPNPSELVAALLNLSKFHLDLKNPVAAKTYAMRSCELCRTAFNPDDSQTIQSHEYLALVEQALDKLGIGAMPFRLMD